MNIFSSNQSNPSHEQLPVATSQEVLEQRARLLREAGSRGMSSLIYRHPDIITPTVEAVPNIAPEVAVQPEVRHLQSVPVEQSNPTAQANITTASQLLAQAQESLRRAYEDEAA